MVNKWITTFFINFTFCFEWFSKIYLALKISYRVHCIVCSHVLSNTYLIGRIHHQQTLYLFKLFSVFIWTRGEIIAYVSIYHSTRIYKYYQFNWEIKGGILVLPENNVSKFYISLLSRYLGYSQLRHAQGFNVGFCFLFTFSVSRSTIFHRFQWTNLFSTVPTISVTDGLWAWFAR